MTLNIPAYIPILTLSLAAITLLFAYIKWDIDRRLKTQLASIVIATRLETLSRHCFQVSIDDGTWNDPEYPHHPHGHGDFNEAQISEPELPNFETLQDVSLIGLKRLDRLMSLRAIQVSITRKLVQAEHHGSPDFKDYFYERRLFYGAFGLIIAELALDIRLSVRSKGMRDTVANERDLLRRTVDALAEKAAHPDVWAETYTRICLYDKTLYWPPAFKHFAPKP